MRVIDYYKSKFVDKIVADTDTTKVHSAFLSVGDIEAQKSSIISLFWQELLFSLCDYYVISRPSGVGKVGIWLREGGSIMNNTYVQNVVSYKKVGYSNIKVDDKCRVFTTLEMANEGACI